MASGSKVPGRLYELSRDGERIVSVQGKMIPHAEWEKRSSEERALLEFADRKPDDDSLEQMVAAGQPKPVREPLEGKRKWVPIAVIVAALLVPAATIWAWRWWEARGPAARAHGLVIIDSVPSGAVLYIDGREVGRTPYVAPNTFAPDTRVPLRVVYPGARDYSDTFPGGVGTTITAELQATQLPP